MKLPARTALPLVTAAVAAVLTLPAATPASTAGTAGTARGVADPVVGQCHQLTYEQIGAQGDPRPAVPCAGEHTTRTIRVAQLPTGLAYRDAQAFSFRTCQGALPAGSGGSLLVLAKSAVNYVFFYPTKAEQEAGARYVRCDIAVLDGRSLDTLVGAKAPSLADGLPDAYRRCNNGYSLYFVCTRPHDHRATASFTIPGKDYPGESTVSQIAFRRCGELTGKPGFYDYYPLASGWASGKREVVCLAATTA